MNKRYLPAIAVLLIAMTCTSFVPVFGQVPTLPTYIYAAPTLTVVTIAQDDQVRGTGVMWLAIDKPRFGSSTNPAQDLMAQYKLLVSYNGVPVAATIFCQYVEKDKDNPIKDKQFLAENLESVPKDVGWFVCKPRWAEPGVGVLDVYYTGSGNPATIADYILIVTATYTVGRNTVVGTDMQDICVLGWPSTTAELVYHFTKPSGDAHYIFDDPLAGWVSCESLALSEKAQLGIPISWS